jgi:ketosteroid isomerase-like protein
MQIKIRHGLMAAVLVLPALAACQQPAAVDTAKEEAAINAQVDAVNAAIKAKDADKLVSIDADDIRGYGGGGPDVASKDEDLKADKVMVADPAYGGSVKAEHLEVAKSGDLAVQTGSFDFTGTNPQTKAVEHSTGHWVAGWRKDKDGAWKMAAIGVAPAGPAAAPAAAPAADAKAPAAPAADAKAAPAPAKK